MAHWLAGHVGVSLVTARQYVHVARVLESYPLLSATFESGRLSYSRVRAVCRVVCPRSEADLVEMALHATAPQLERFVAEVERASQPTGREDDVRQHDCRELVIITQEDGTVLVRARLSAEAGTALRRAVETQMQREISLARAAEKAAGPEVPSGHVIGVEVPFHQLRALG